MNPTKLGHILVYVTLTLSLLCATWAVAIYSQNVVLAPQTAGNAKVKGAIEERKEEIAELQKAKDRAEALIQAELAELHELEDRRSANRAWYRDLINIEDTGKDTQGKPVQPAVREMKYEGGVIQVDGDGRPVFGGPVLDEVKKQPLLSYEQYIAQIKALWLKLDEDRKTINGLIAENARITEEINGAPGKPGLRDLLAEQKRKEKEAREQIAFLEPQIFNAHAQIQLLEKRLGSMGDRLKELQRSVGAAASAVGTAGKTVLDIP